MESEDFNNKIEFLIDRWCDRRQLEPLRHILNARVSLNGLTDGWNDFLRDLKTIRTNYSKSIKDDEFEALVALIYEADKAVNRC